MLQLSKRKSNRLQSYDYSQNGAYFITVCAKDRAEIFGFFNVGAAICRPHIELTSVGNEIKKAIQTIPNVYNGICVSNYVIMPNHLHMLISIDIDHGRQVTAPTVSLVIGNMKRSVSIKIGFSPWQKSFHDHIIRNEEEYRKIYEYIENNPENWENDCFYKQAQIATATKP